MIDVCAEFALVEFGDRRLNARCDQIVARMVDVPSRSFPNAMRSDAELEGAYRFFNNGRVTLYRLLAPHFETTVRRAEQQTSTPVIIHDTTELRYEGTKARHGLGKIAMDGQGFFGHFALAVTDDETPRVLGLAGLLTYTREQKTGRAIGSIDITKRRQMVRESDRWCELVQETHERMGHLVPIHVMDREADDFALFSEMTNRGMRFVTRMTPQRRRKGHSDDVEVSSPYVQEIAKAAPIVATREVRISARGYHRGGYTRTYAPRESRSATLHICATTIDVQPPRDLLKKLAPLRLSVLRVFEPDPPDGEEPVEWILYSNELIETAPQVLKIIDVYRSRWMIEEFFKALKTGCAIERRQLESLDALLAVLGLLAPMAVRLLALRNMARIDPDAPATELLDSDELAVLRAIARTKLRRTPNAREVLFAIAGLGGHLVRNGDPGWLTMARGFEKLDIAVRTMIAMRDGKAPM